MKEPREISIQKEVMKYLEKLELFPFSVICSFAIPPGDGILSITFYTKNDFNEFLNYIDYENQCDSRGYLILGDSNTIILSSLGLMNFYTSMI